MKRLGISVYPEHSSLEECMEYMTLASKYGFTRVFTCLLSVKESKEEIIANFSKLCNHAHKCGMVVAVDTHPGIFDKLGATPYDLAPFKEIGVDIIRLDGHFDAMGDIAITKNPYGILIEYNASCTMALDMMIEAGANKTNMCICSNFYPQRYTGMGLERFKELNSRYLPLGLNNAAFVTSLQPHTHGPWEVYEGLPTLEIHRDLPIDLQLRHLNALGYNQDFLIGNAFASEDELKAMSKVNLNTIQVRVDLKDDLTDVEKEIVCFNRLSSRDDNNELVIRASYPRIHFKDCAIAPRAHGKDMFERGDVIIVNDNLKHYAAELMIVLQPIKASDRYNLVGTINKDEQMILDCIKAQYSFELLCD